MKTLTHTTVPERTLVSHRVFEFPVVTLDSSAIIMEQLTQSSLHLLRDEHLRLDNDPQN